MLGGGAAAAACKDLSLFSMMTSDTHETFFIGLVGSEAWKYIEPAIKAIGADERKLFKVLFTDNNPINRAEFFAALSTQLLVMGTDLKHLEARPLETINKFCVPFFADFTQRLKGAFLKIPDYTALLVEFDSKLEKEMVDVSAPSREDALQAVAKEMLKEKIKVNGDCDVINIIKCLLLVGGLPKKSSVQLDSNGMRVWKVATRATPSSSLHAVTACQPTSAPAHCLAQEKDCIDMETIKKAIESGHFQSTFNENIRFERRPFVEVMAELRSLLDDTEGAPPSCTTTRASLRSPQQRLCAHPPQGRGRRAPSGA